ncbi:hypothetical protein PFLUV_G00050010 [Perca fluviatilis]|uniref:Uncharacterized protein n=1 Tax=Perca fluviatilis TaxID=8168 RepID=A0A6A5FPV5_PERFL|nr:hypothetical protein PFLUV_G00050010 [Perca fluviatilis]
MKAAMAGDLQKRYIDLKATLHACSAMDPRFKSLPFLTENERQEVYDGLIVEAARSMQPSESLWSVDEEGTANAHADDEGMASKEDEDAVDEGEQFMEGESSQGQHPPPRNPRPSCPLAALLGERYGGAARPKTNTQQDEAQEQMTRYKEADLLEWEAWMTSREKSFTKTGRMQRATYGQVCQWVLTAWSIVKKSTIINGFRKAGLLHVEEGSAGDLPPDESDKSDNENNPILDEAILRLFNSNTEGDDFSGFSAQEEEYSEQ